MSGDSSTFLKIWRAASMNSFLTFVLGFMVMGKKFVGFRSGPVPFGSPHAVSILSRSSDDKDQVRCKPSSADDDAMLPTAAAATR